MAKAPFLPTVALIILEPGLIVFIKPDLLKISAVSPPSLKRMARVCETDKTGFVKPC